MPIPIENITLENILQSTSLSDLTEMASTVGEERRQANKAAVRFTNLLAAISKREKALHEGGAE